MQVGTGTITVARVRELRERERQLDEAAQAVAEFVRVVLVHRALREARLPEQTFWVVMNNAVFDTAIIGFCKLFGTDDKKHHLVHWKNVVRDVRSFETALRRSAGVTRAEWHDYKDDIKKHRDWAAAHHSVERRQLETFPRYDLALKAAKFYYERATERLKEEFGIGYEPRHLEGYEQEFLKQAMKFARLAIDATRDEAEMVDFPRRR